MPTPQDLKLAEEIVKNGYFDVFGTEDGNKALQKGIAERVADGIASERARIVGIVKEACGEENYDEGRLMGSNAMRSRILKSLEGEK